MQNTDRFEKILHISFKDAFTLTASNPTVRQALLLLQRKGMLEEITGRSWGKLYLVKPIMDTIELKRKSK